MYRTLALLPLVLAACGNTNEADCLAACDSLSDAELASCVDGLEVCDDADALTGGLLDDVTGDSCRDLALAGFELTCGLDDTDGADTDDTDAE